MLFRFFVVVIDHISIIYVLIINTGLYMYTEIREQQEQEAQSDIWVIDDFYKYQLMKGMLYDK